MKHRPIETERLILRRWRSEDRAPFAEICADPDVMRFIGDGSTRTADEAARAIERFEDAWEARGYGLFAVEHRATGALIGFAGFSRPDFLPELLPSLEIGWRFGKAHWGRGYATEAAQAALGAGATALAEEEIVGIFQSENGASIRIMEKLGLHFDRRTVDPSCGRDVEVYRLSERSTLGDAVSADGKQEATEFGQTPT